MLRSLLPLALPFVAVGIWWLIAARYPTSIVPGPASVWERLISAWQQGIFLPAVGTTFEEAGLGWVIGSAIALPIGYLIGKWQPLERTVAPYLAASQALPVVAIAPLLVIWLGFGLEPKIVIAGLIVFFPVVTTTASGIRSIDPDLRDIARVFGASPFQTLIYLDIPRAARSILTGEKISAALAVTGALVAELVNSDQGLGYLVQFGRQSFDTPLVFVAALALMAMGAAAYALLSTFERMVVQWTE